ncbi:MAG: benzoyl-CoA-dihydrodiol lyase, partial [Planctomycetes bacterium]|nr:benzoyl-CoA-dihydrodiol lyase [Planctomycetota bacterium]
WGLVDALAPLSRFDEEVTKLETEMMKETSDKSGRQGVALAPITPEVDDDAIRYRHVTVDLKAAARTAKISIRVPADAKAPKSADEARAAGANWWFFRLMRELDDALLRLRFNHSEIGLLLLETRGSIEAVLANDAALETLAKDWFVNEVRHHTKRVLKRLDLTAKSIFAIVDEGSCFAGTLLELALAADRIYALNDPDVEVQMASSSLNGGAYPMANGLSRLQTRFLRTPDQVKDILDEKKAFDIERAEELGLTTSAPDDIDWEDEIRVACEERASFSPDALTGMEANLRFAGPETMETKIFGRLSAWQNWIFQRPNAVGARGALSCYGEPTQPEFDYQRT